MSLDVYLEVDKPLRKRGPRSGIFVRDDGRMREITREEWDRRNPGCEPVISTAGLEEDETLTAFSANITHNLGKMAGAAGIYDALWRPDEHGIETAAQLIEPLTTGLAKLRASPAKYEEFNPSNGWGSYDGLVDFVEGYLSACEQWPNAKVRVWR